MTEAQWATAAGYKRSGGTWGAYKSRLRGAGLIETKDGRWFATETGAEAAGDDRTAAAGRSRPVWSAGGRRACPGTPKIAEALIGAWPHDMTRDELASAVDMSAAGGSFGAYLSRLASPGIIERDGGMIRLSAEAMGSRRMSDRDPDLFDYPDHPGWKSRPQDLRTGFPHWLEEHGWRPYAWSPDVPPFPPMGGIVTVKPSGPFVDLK